MGDRLLTHCGFDHERAGHGHRQPPTPAETVIHSDHGVQFGPWAFTRWVKESGPVPSMGSIGDCYDNAMCESFFATLEAELLDRHRFPTPDHARLAVFDYIEGWYNPRRRHSALDYLSPINFEKRELSRV